MPWPEDPEAPRAVATPTPVDLQLTTQEDEAPPSPPLPSGSRFARYVIHRLLGSGGMGEVYLAEDEQLGRMVALKRLAPRLIVSGPALERFRREARAASALNHPNVIAIYEAGDFEDQHYIASEFVEGRTLRHLLWERSLGLPQVLELVAQAAEALAAAHEAGIIHRDVKPENLMVRPDGWLKVLDFGLAKSARERLRVTPDQTLAETAPNVIIGTVQYMSPEQARGQALDARTDVWSLAVVAFELLSFQSPFARPTSTDTLAAILRDMPPPLPEPLRDLAGGHLERLLLRCLAKEREDRPPSMRALLEEWTAIREAALGGTGARPRSALPEESSQLVALLDEPTLAPGHNLPELLAPLVGREAERATLTALLRGGSRLVTLTGAGGTGKTRLALQAARDLLLDFPAGVRLVGLAAVDDAVLVPDAIAECFGLHEGAGRSALNMLRDHLRSRRERVLLVLDNLEQVHGAVDVVDELLQDLPNVSVLATSRERLRHRAERELPVDPLPVPPADGVQRPAALLGWSSVALFAQAARGVQPGFVLDGENATVVAEICRRLDGLPLAIELAAARTKLLSPAELLARLERPLAVLTAGPRDLPARQRTMRDAVSWGHALLDADEQRLFRELAVFVGGFTVEAAEAVGGRDDGPAVLDLLQNLVDKSLLRRVEHGDESRFEMLQTIREFALERLRAEGAEPAREAHARWFTALAERGAVALQGSAQATWLERLEAEHPNLRAAIDHWDSSQRHAEGLRLCGALWWFWYLRGHYAEGRRRLQRVLEQVPSDRAGSGAASLGAGVLAFLQCDYEVAERHLADALARFEKEGDARGLASCEQYRGSLARERGDLAAAVDWSERGREAWARAGVPGGVARATNAIALACWLAGDLERAGREANDALRAFRGLSDAEGVTWGLLNLSSVARYGGEAQRATVLAREALSVAVEAGYREGIAWSLDLLGNLALADGQPAVAGRHLRKALELHWELGDRWRLGSVLESLAASRAGTDPRGAAGLLRAAERLRLSISAPVPPVESAAVEALRQLLSAELARCDVRAETLDDVIRGASGRGGSGARERH